MTEETKEAVRLLIECMDELRRHDESIASIHYTNPALKERLAAFMAKHQIDEVDKAVAEL